MNKSLLLKALVAVVSIPLISLCAYCCFHIHDMAIERGGLKKDYSDINGIAYGLLSVEVWKNNIEEIAAGRINDFELTPQQRDSIESAITDVLKKVILQADSLVQNNKTLKGKLRKLAYNTFVDKKTFLKKAPQFSHNVTTEILKPKNKQKIKNLAIEKLEEYASQTFGDTTDAYRMSSVLAKYHYSDKNEFNTKSTPRIDYLQRQSYQLTFVVVGVMLLFLLAWLVIYRNKKLQKLFFGFSVLLALVVLLAALTSPMIEVDARIKQMDFMLIGTHMQFNDQVLFYQSKSILQVVQILLNTKAIDSTIVGILLLIFSIVFPITKLICTQVYLFGNERMKANRLIYFFAIKSGKWSMADVMVVAIFMAYVGFKGILDDQLQSLNYNTASLRSISTNLTSLQPAYILFLSFVIYSLILSEILNIIQKKHALIS